MERGEGEGGREGEGEVDILRNLVIFYLIYMPQISDIFIICFFFFFLVYVTFFFF